ncbi:MAG: SRPBCC family protein [Deltaproteobacteria bacterium]|nr:SRPBCC family protein [Deltaproteobacteria bacterium]
MKRTLTAIIALAASSISLAGPYDPPVQLPMGAEQVEALARRELVTGFDKVAGVAWGAVDVAAPPSAVLAAIMDLEARVAEQGSLTGMSRYLDEPSRVGARWVASIMGSEWVFYVVYELDAVAATVSYRLDPTQQSDLSFNQGIYQVLPQGEGSRLLFRGRMESGTKLPGWVKSWLAQDSTESQLGGLRTRAEAASAK